MHPLLPPKREHQFEESGEGRELTSLQSKLQNSLRFFFFLTLFYSVLGIISLVLIENGGSMLFEHLLEKVKPVNFSLINFF